MNTYRYIIRIRFNLRPWGYQLNWGVHEPVKTLKEAESYKEMVDDTVYEANVYDNVTKRVACEWKTPTNKH